MVGARAPQRPVAASAALAPRQGPVHHRRVGGRLGRRGGAAQQSESRVRVATRRSRSGVSTRRGAVEGTASRRWVSVAQMYSKTGSRVLTFPSGQSRYCNNKNRANAGVSTKIITWKNKQLTNQEQVFASQSRS